MDKYKVFRQGAWSNFYDLPLQVTWNLTGMCNYRCSYCFDQNKPTKETFLQIDNYEKAILNIAMLNRPWYSITLLGGEPSIHPHFLEIIRLFETYINNRINFISIISNGSFHESVYQELSHMTVNINLIISLHSEYANFERMVSIIKDFSNNLSITFNVMHNPAKNDYVKYMVAKLLELRASYPFNMVVVPLRQPPEFSSLDIRYQKEDVEWQETINTKFKEVSIKSDLKYRYKTKFSVRCFSDILNSDGHRGIAAYNKHKDFLSGKLNFHDMFCMSGSHLLQIDSLGRCRGLDCPVEDFTGSIYNDNPYQSKDFIHYIKCPYDCCDCATNHKTPKFADEIEAAEFLHIVRSRQQILLEQ